MKLTLSFVSLAALAAAAPLKASVWTKVGEGDHPRYRVGLAGASAFSSHLEGKAAEPNAVDSDLIQIMPFPAPMPSSIPPHPPAAIDSGFASPPFIPADMILPSAPDSVGEGQGQSGSPGRKPCHGMAKSVELSNWLRKVMGMPEIAIEPVRAHSAVKVIHIEFKPVPVRFPTKAAIASTDAPTTSKHHHHHHHHKSHSEERIKEWQKRPFADRLTHALMSLGRWEGRIVAFVLGCGIGVLLRLVWVMGVLFYRSIHNRGSDDEHDEHETVLTEEEAYLLPPPEYTDEKVALAAAAEEQRST